MDKEIDATLNRVDKDDESPEIISIKSDFIIAIVFILVIYLIAYYVRTKCNDKIGKSELDFQKENQLFEACLSHSYREHFEKLDGEDVRKSRKRYLLKRKS